MNLGCPIWDRFNGSYALPEDRVQVWQTSLDMAASRLAAVNPFPGSARTRRRGAAFAVYQAVIWPLWQPKVRPGRPNAGIAIRYY